MRSWLIRYEPNILEAAIRVCCQPQASEETREVSTDDLHIGAFVAEDIRKYDGVLIVPRGVELTSSVIAHIRRFRSELAKDTLRIACPEEDKPHAMA